MSLTCITSLCTPQLPKPSRIALSKPSYTLLLNPAFWTRDITKTRVRGGAACRSAFELNVVFPEAQPKARTVTPEHSQMPIRMWFLRNWLRLEISIASEATRTRLADASSDFCRGAEGRRGGGRARTGPISLDRLPYPDWMSQIALRLRSRIFHAPYDAPFSFTVRY